MKVALFLCTANYYRSRFAEDLFNYLAPVEMSWMCRGVPRDCRGPWKQQRWPHTAAQTVSALQHRGVNLDRQPLRVPMAAHALGP